MALGVGGCKGLPGARSTAHAALHKLSCKLLSCKPLSCKLLSRTFVLLLLCLVIIVVPQPQLHSQLLLNVYLLQDSMIRE